MYSIEFTKTAEKELYKLEKNIQIRIINTLERLRIKPTTCDTKKLIEISGYRLRVGDYRIIFDINEEKLIILIIEIGYRKKIYKF